MTVKELLLAEFDREMLTTRKFLERVPMERPEWKPHEKSMPLGRLATHVATLPSVAARLAAGDTFDMSPPGAPPRQFVTITDRNELLAAFDRDAAEARKIIESQAETDFGREWTLLAGGRKIFSLPRASVVLTMMLGHLIHHRAQLGVYLRMNGVPVPASFGPSADEGRPT